MRILVFLPIDTVFKTWARRLEADGHEVEATHAFSVFRKRVCRADWTLVNSAKFDSPKYVWKILLSVLYARLRGRRVAVFMSIDTVDLCDRPVLRAWLWCMNRCVLRSASLVILLSTRAHILRRYGIFDKKVLYVDNCPDREAFAPVRRIPNPDRPVTFFYHGELLWWHGLERFLPIYEAIRKRRPARLIVAGNFYPTVFRVFGFAASRREVAVKRQLAALLERGDVDYRGRADLAGLRRIMAETDFHVTLLSDEGVQARTELRTCLLEAMAAGLVCLHTPTPGLVLGIFRDGENVVTLDPRDPAFSARKILALADAPDLLESIRRNAVRTIEAHFDLEAQYRRLAASLNEAQSRAL